jgi:hypothetical protein
MTGLAVITRMVQAYSGSEAPVLPTAIPEVEFVPGEKPLARPMVLSKEEPWHKLNSAA